jgi:hypothetical protein
MDSFLRRLKYYGIGFGIGLVFVFIFFQNRGCSWLPSNRVKNSFLDRLIVIPEGEKAAMKAINLTKQDVVNVLNDGDVSFDESIKEGATKVYVLQKEYEGKGNVRFYFTLPKESFISEVHISEKYAAQVKNSTSGYGDIVHFPKDDHLIYVDSSKLLNCQQEILGLLNPMDILKHLKKSGKIDFAKTNYAQRPKVEQYIEFIDAKKRKVGAKAIWYKNKINITAFDVPFENDCK